MDCDLVFLSVITIGRVFTNVLLGMASFKPSLLMIILEGLWAQEVCHCCGLLQARKVIDQGGGE